MTNVPFFGIYRWVCYWKFSERLFVKFLKTILYIFPIYLKMVVHSSREEKYPPHFCYWPHTSEIARGNQHINVSLVSTFRKELKQRMAFWGCFESWDSLISPISSSYVEYVGDQKYSNLDQNWSKFVDRRNLREPWAVSNRFNLRNVN